MGDYKLELDDKLLNIINLNSKYRNIASELIVRLSLDVDVLEMKEIVKKLVEEYKYSEEEILNGKVNKTIKLLLVKERMAHYAENMSEEQLNALINNTKKRSIEKAPKTPLKTKKRKNLTKPFAFALAGVLIISGSIHIKNTIQDAMLENDVSDNLGMLASNIGEEDYEHKRSILQQNKYMAGLDAEGFPIVAYDFHNIANDIIKICEQDPSLFDITLCDIYFDMQNRLENIDDLLRELKNQLSNNDNLQNVYTRIKDVDVFLEYLLNLGLISSQDDLYNELLSDIGEYKLARGEGNVTYNLLSTESQKRIDKLIDLYREQKSRYNEMYGNRLENLVKEQGEDYGRN